MHRNAGLCESFSSLVTFHRKKKNPRKTAKGSLFPAYSTSRRRQTWWLGAPQNRCHERLRVKGQEGGKHDREERAERASGLLVWMAAALLAQRQRFSGGIHQSISSRRPTPLLGGPPLRRIIPKIEIFSCCFGFLMAFRVGECFFKTRRIWKKKGGRKEKGGETPKVMFAVIEEPGKEKWPFWRRARACGCVWATVGVAVGDCGRLCVLARLTLHEAFQRQQFLSSKSVVLAKHSCHRWVRRGAPLQRARARAHTMQNKTQQGTLDGVMQSSTGKGRTQWGICFKKKERKSCCLFSFWKGIYPKCGWLVYYCSCARCITFSQALLFICPLSVNYKQD